MGRNSFTELFAQLHIKSDSSSAASAPASWLGDWECPSPASAHGHTFCIPRPFFCYPAQFFFIHFGKQNHLLMAQLKIIFHPLWARSFHMVPENFKRSDSPLGISHHWRNATCWHLLQSNYHYIYNIESDQLQKKYLTKLKYKNNKRIKLAC